MLKQPHSGVTRVPYVRPCRFAVGVRDLRQGFLCNISALGLYVAVDPAPAVGEQVRLRFSPGEGESPIELDAEVAWRNQREEPKKAYGLPQGCGLRFTALARQDEERMKALVDRYARTRAMDGSEP